MTQLVSDLKAARDLIADPARWTTGEYARNHHGDAVDGNDDNAVCWCADGALGKIMDLPDGKGHAYSALTRACLGLFDKNIHETNDTLGHAAILQAFDLAISTASDAESGRVS